jgi:hypothetical protein
MIVYEYLGGLPTGHPRDEVEVRLADCCLHFAHQTHLLYHRRGQRKPWSYDLPLANIADIEVNTGANELVIAAQIAGAPASVVLHGRPAELVRLRQMTLHARARTEERES